MTSDSFRAFTATNNDGVIERTVTTLTKDQLPEGALIDVQWSSVNFKDALATTAKGRVARISPLVPGIDLAGTLVDGGAPVIAHGYDIGVSRHGGYAELASVPEEWIVQLPTGLDLRQAMIIGTAGFTAALSVVALEERGLTPADGPVLVTGATGGVGSMAVSILATRGYEVVASTGKAESEPFLRSLGATSIIDRSVLGGEVGKPLDSMTWAAAVDCVGGTTLVNVLAKINYGGAVAASGLTGGTAVPTTVMPFILRNVALLGIDSVQTPIERRRAVWERLGSDLKPAGLDEIGHDVGLDDLGVELDRIMAGGQSGRVVVDVRR